MEKRKEALTNLIFLKGDFHVAINRIAEFEWDSEVDLWILEKTNIGHAFDLLSKGEISIQILEDWANAIECREDIGYADDITREIINELANPTLYGPLTEEHIYQLKETLFGVS